MIIKNSLLTGTISIIVVSLFISGCSTANRTTAFRTFTTTGGQSVSVDAKQRFLINNNRQVYDANKKTMVTAAVLCAEPSPDALSAFAAALDTSLSVNRGSNKTNLGFGESLNEAAGSIGLRTQTITILRDELYRFCEGYAIGALDENEFRRLHRRNQANQLGLLAIEQITGAVRAPAIALGSTGSAGATKALEAAIGSVEARELALEKAQVQLETAREDADKALTQQIASKENLDKAEAALKAATDANKAELTTKRNAAQQKLIADTKVVAKQDEVVSKAEGDLDDRKKNLETAQKILENVRRRASANSSATVTMEHQIPENGGLSEGAVHSITTAAESIVKTIVTTSYAFETCLNHLSPPATMQTATVAGEAIKPVDPTAPLHPTTILCNVLLSDANAQLVTNRINGGDNAPTQKDTATASPNSGAGKLNRGVVERALEIYRQQPPVPQPK